MRSTISFGMPALVLLSLLPVSTPAQPQGAPLPLAVTAEGWTMAGDVRVERHLGREAFRFGSGSAYFPSQRFVDGTIEFDVAASPLRTFVGVRFRTQSADVWEEIYVRPHKTGLPDTVQYAPAFAGGRSAWQLYHGPGETTAAALPHDTWVRVKVIVKGSQAAVFLRDAAAPVLLVPRLAHPTREGFIGFAAVDASAERGKGFPSAVSNIVVRPGVAEFAFPEPPPEAVPPGTIAPWEVSSAFVPATPGPVTELPAAVLNGPWRRATADRSGLVPLERFVELPDGARRVAALARVTLRAVDPAVVPLSLGFSDDATVFLNRQPVFSGVNGYSYNFPRRDGLITGDQATVYLPLRAGDNELLLAVSDVFGGWGFMGRLIAPPGVTVEAR